MDTTSKRHKLHEEQSERTFEDRISSLPSSLLGEILSYLPTKDAVATSVLSSRWKGLWTLVTRLYFDDYFVPRAMNMLHAEVMPHDKFVSFVYRVLVLGRFSHITAFRLYCWKKHHPLLVNTSLAFVLNCNIQEIDISVPLSNSIVLPSNLFTCRTLVKLELGRKIVMNVPGQVCLPCVKEVDLTEVRFPDDDAITRFFGGCPVLDRLAMTRCMGKNVKVMKILVPSLTCFEVEHLCFDETCVRSRDDPTFRIVLDTPLLSHLFIKDYIPDSVVVKKPLLNLKTARIHIFGPLSWDMKSIRPLEDMHRAAVTDLLVGLSKVRKFCIRCQDIGRCLLPTFENLREMAVADREPLSLDTILKFLERTPKLCLLFAVLNEDETGNSFEFELPPQKIPNCLLSDLKTIKLTNFVGSRGNIKIVKYFLKHAQVLEKLTIERKVNSSVAATSDFLVNMLTASSKVCQIVIL